MAIVNIMSNEDASLDTSQQAPAANLKEYQRRKGCVNLGGDYECLKTALFSLRCALSENVEEFWIASNASFVGDCDDIVLYIKSIKGDQTAYLIQLKHMETTKKLMPNHFTYLRESKKEKTDENQKENTDEEKDPKRNKKKDNFAIEKYWLGFEKLQENLSNPEHKSDIIKKLREVDNIILMLYTNREVEDCNFLKQVDLSDNFFDLLGTNGIKHCYGFDHSKLPSIMFGWEKFLQKFYLFANQIHAEEVINVMKTKIQNYFNLTVPLIVNFEDVAKEYLEYVQTWIKGYKIGKDRKYCAITKSDVLKTLVGILLNQYNSCKYEFSTKDFTHYNDSTKMIWNKIISEKDITLLNNSDQSVITFIQSYYGSELLKYLKKLPQVWNQVLSKNVQQSFYKTFGHAKVAQVCHNDKLSIMNIYKTLWMHGSVSSVPMLLHLDDTKKYFKDVLKLLQACKHLIKVIVLVADSSNVQFIKNKLKCFVTFQDLHPDQQNKLLGVDVSFQGRTVPLNNLVNTLDTNMYKTIKCHDVINIVSKNFIIGRKYEKMSDFFRVRKLSRVFLKYEVLKTPNETFVIETHDKAITQENLKDFISPKSKIHFINSSETRKKYKGTVHRLIHNEKCLEWRESLGSTKNLRSYQIESQENQYEEILQKNFTRNVYNQTRIISACPGMGKSILIDFFALFAPENVWVIKINLSQMVQSKITLKSVSKPKHKQVSSDSSESDISDDDDTSSSKYDILSKSFDVFNYFDTMITDDQKIQTREISLAIFKKFLKANEVLILLDGFDEISISYKEKVTEIIRLLQSKQHQVWVTTRDHMKTHLEDALSVLALTLEPFTLEQQKSFLNIYFNSKINNKITSDTTANELIINEFIDRLLQAAAVNLRDQEGRFTGIPLHIKLLGEVFFKSCKKSCKHKKVEFNERFNLLTLYDEFVTKKNKILVEKFGSNENDWLKGIEEAQQYFALYNVFDSYALRNFKIETKLAQYYDDVNSQQVQREGILVVVKSKNGMQIEFIHRTFAEYFVAKFLSKNFSNSDNHVRQNVLSLINYRFCYRDDYEFLFSIFDLILAQTNSLHLKIVNLKVDKIDQKIKMNPNVLLEQDEFQRTGLHILVVYSKEIPESDMESWAKNVESLKVNDLETTDRLGYNVLDYCFYFSSYVLAKALCTKAPYLPFKIYSDVSFPKNEPTIFRTIFHNFLIRSLLVGEIAEDMLIYDYCRRLTTDLDIICDSWTFKTYLNVATVSEYLKLVNIKDSKTSTYFDIRFAVALGSKKNVEDLFASQQIDVNKIDANNGNSLLHYASENKRSDIFGFLLDQDGDINVPGRNGDTVIHILARTGQVGLLEKCLDSTENYDVENDDRVTPVDEAIRFKKTDAARILVKRGAFINKKNAAFIHDAAKAGDNKLVLKLIQNKFNINYQLDNQKTALHSALENNHIETAKLLIKHNIDFSLDTTSESLLHLAAKIGNQELFELFLLKGCNIDRINKLGETPLIKAVQHGHAELTEFIISKGADISIQYGNTLSKSINLGSEKIVSLILNHGCDINETISSQGRTPLLMALDQATPTMARLILSRSPSPDVTLADSDGVTPLHKAAANGFVDLVIEFLNRQADINAQTDQHETPLLMALERRNLDVAEILFNNNANVLLEDKKGQTPLHYAASLGQRGLVTKFLTKGADVNKENKLKWTPLLLALKNGHNETANFLLEQGGDLTKEADYQSSTLHLASESGNARIVLECLKLKMNINAKDTFENTPLFCALKKKQIDTALLLIRHGADYTLKNDCQDTILHLAAKIGNDDFLRQMLNKGLDINAINRLHETPLCVALKKGHVSTAELLLSQGSKRDSVCKDGRSVLHLAACSGFEALLRECLNMKIFDIDKEDNEGMSALEYAIGYGNIGCVKQIVEAGAHTNATYIYCLFDAMISKMKTENDMNEALSLFQTLVARCGNISRQNKDQNTVLHQIILRAKKARANDMADYGEKFFEELLKLLIKSGADAAAQNCQGKSAYDLINEDSCLDHLMYIFNSKSCNET